MNKKEELLNKREQLITEREAIYAKLIAENTALLIQLEDLEIKLKNKESLKIYKLVAELRTFQKAHLKMPTSDSIAQVKEQIEALVDELILKKLGKP